MTRPLGAWTWCTGDVHGTSPVEQAARLRAFRDAYDVEMASTRILDAIDQAQQGVIAGESAQLEDARQSDARREHAARAVHWAWTDREHLARNLEVFRSALDD